MSSTRVSFLVTLLTSFVLVLISIQSVLAQEGPRLKCFVTILPQAFFIERIGGDRVESVVLVGPGQSPHTYEPTPRQMAQLSESQVYFTIGIPIEEALQKKIESIKIDKGSVTVADGATRNLVRFANQTGIVSGLTTDVPEKDEVKEDSSAKTKTTVKYAGPLVGNRVVAQEVVESTDAEDGSVKLSIGLKESSSKPADKAVVLKDGEMSATLDAVVKLCEKVVAYKKEQSKTESIAKDLSKAADSIVKALDTQNSTGEDKRSKELKTAVSNIKAACTSVQAVTLRLTTLAPSMAVSAGNAANQYVRESLAQYKDDK